mmetsp:Transcript_56356/g.175199  ORF Transcript_56356/g.175199 Transcript_56356/m.175199 type:complete len:787 (+) Transcript_56356:25-2385(+)
MALQSYAARVAAAATGNKCAAPGNAGATGAQARHRRPGVPSPPHPLPGAALQLAAPMPAGGPAQAPGAGAKPAAAWTGRPQPPQVAQPAPSSQPSKPPSRSSSQPPAQPLSPRPLPPPPLQLQQQQPPLLNFRESSTSSVPSRGPSVPSAPATSRSAVTSYVPPHRSAAPGVAAAAAAAAAAAIAATSAPRRPARPEERLTATGDSDAAVRAGLSGEQREGRVLACRAPDHFAVSLDSSPPRSRAESESRLHPPHPTPVEAAALGNAGPPSVAGLCQALQVLRATLAEQQRQQDLQASALREGLMAIHEQRTALARLMEERGGCEGAAGGGAEDALRADQAELGLETGQDLVSCLKALSESRSASVIELQAKHANEVAEVLSAAKQQHEELMAAIAAERTARAHETAELRSLLLSAAAGPAEEIAALARRGEQSCAEVAQAVDDERAVRAREVTELRGMLEAQQQRARQQEASGRLESVMEEVMQRVQAAEDELSQEVRRLSLALAAAPWVEALEATRSEFFGEVQHLSAALAAAPWAGAVEAARSEILQEVRCASAALAAAPRADAAEPAGAELQEEVQRLSAAFAAAPWLEAVEAARSDVLAKALAPDLRAEDPEALRAEMAELREGLASTQRLVQEIGCRQQTLREELEEAARQVAGELLQPEAGQSQLLRQPKGVQMGAALPTPGIYDGSFNGTDADADAGAGARTGKATVVEAAAYADMTLEAPAVEEVRSAVPAEGMQGAPPLEIQVESPNEVVPGALQDAAGPGSPWRWAVGSLFTRTP